MSNTFEKEFSVLRQMGDKTFVLRGSTLIVEILEPEELKTKGGLIIATDAKHVAGHSVIAHKVETGRVLMSGQGYWVDGVTEYPSATTLVYTKETPGRYESLDCQPGAIVLLPQNSIQLMSHFPGIQRPTANKLALIKMDQILAYYPTQEAYEAAKKELNI